MASKVYSRTIHSYPLRRLSSPTGRWSARNASTFTGSRTASRTWSVLPPSRELPLILTRSHKCSLHSSWRSTRSASRRFRATLERLNWRIQVPSLVVLNPCRTLHRNRTILSFTRGISSEGTILPDSFPDEALTRHLRGRGRGLRFLEKGCTFFLSHFLAGLPAGLCSCYAFSVTRDDDSLQSTPAARVPTAANSSLFSAGRLAGLSPAPGSIREESCVRQ